MDENNHDKARDGTVRSSWKSFWSRFTAEPEPTVAHRLYEPLVRHARLPLYYDRLGVPDTPEGRFEVLALHVGLVVRRLFSLDDDGRKVGQALFDLMVADLDSNLRELGVGDLSVGKQVKRLAGQFYARLAVLDDAFGGGGVEALLPMLETNVHKGVADGSPAPAERIRHLADIVVAQKEALDRQDPAELKAGRVILLGEPDLIALQTQVSGTSQDA